MNYLSNKEREYRSKIIAENHLKKDAQKYLDFYVEENNSHSIKLTYKHLYFEYGLLHSILVKYNFSKLNNAIKNVGFAAKKVANSLSKALSTFSAFSEFDI